MLWWHELPAVAGGGRAADAGAVTPAGLAGEELIGLAREPAFDEPSEEPADAGVAPEGPEELAPLDAILYDLGEASFYHSRFEGRRTASGEPYRGEALTAAHRTLPFGTTVRVTNLQNGRIVLVRINDRGPFHPRRVIDLSRAAARELGMVRAGRALVQVEILD
jgi:rare lipoprotein A